MSTNKPIYKLLDWINIDKLDWTNLSYNKNAINLLEQNKNKINWKNLSFNKMCKNATYNICLFNVFLLKNKNY